MEELLLNRIKTPDGTTLTSWDRHDYKTHLDKNGETFMVDGGRAYLRRNLVAGITEELSRYYKPEDHEHNRQYAYWGTYGKEGDQPLYHIFVKDMETDHICKVLGECRPHPTLEAILEAELEYRNEPDNS